MLLKGSLSLKLKSYSCYFYTVIKIIPSIKNKSSDIFITMSCCIGMGRTEGIYVYQCTKSRTHFIRSNLLVIFKRVSFVGLTNPLEHNALQI